MWIRRTVTVSTVSEADGTSGTADELINLPSHEKLCIHNDHLHVKSTYLSGESSSIQVSSRHYAPASSPAISADIEQPTLA